MTHEQGRAPLTHEHRRGPHPKAQPARRSPPLEPDGHPGCRGSRRAPPQAICTKHTDSASASNQHGHCAEQPSAEVTHPRQAVKPANLKRLLKTTNPPQLSSLQSWKGSSKTSEPPSHPLPPPPEHPVFMDTKESRTQALQNLRTSKRCI